MHFRWRHLPNGGLQMFHCYFRCIKAFLIPRRLGQRIICIHKKRGRVRGGEMYKYTAKLKSEFTSIAAIAASRHISDMSAPVQPLVSRASSSTHMSELHGIFFKCIWNIASLSFSSGGPTYSNLSKRPNKNSTIFK